MYKDIEPLYKQLYAYIRRKLSEKYGKVRLALIHQFQFILCSGAPLEFFVYRIVGRSRR